MLYEWIIPVAPGMITEQFSRDKKQVSKPDLSYNQTAHP
jgi:hypothetical protein